MLSYNAYKMRLNERTLDAIMDFNHESYNPTLKTAIQQRFNQRQFLSPELYAMSYNMRLTERTLDASLVF